MNVVRFHRQYRKREGGDWGGEGRKELRGAKGTPSTARSCCCSTEDGKKKPHLLNVRLEREGGTNKSAKPGGGGFFFFNGHRGEKRRRILCPLPETKWGRGEDVLDYEILVLTADERVVELERGESSRKTFSGEKRKMGKSAEN